MFLEMITRKFKLSLSFLNGASPEEGLDDIHDPHKHSLDLFNYPSTDHVICLLTNKFSDNIAQYINSSP